MSHYKEIIRMKDFVEESIKTGGDGVDIKLLEYQVFRRFPIPKKAFNDFINEMLSLSVISKTDKGYKWG